MPEKSPGSSREYVLVEQDGGVAVITLNRPEVHNAINTPMRERLLSELLRLDEDVSCHCILLTGAGQRAFSAGFDIREIASPDPDEARAQRHVRDAWIEKILQLNIPIVAALNGVTYGAGVLLALASDVRYGSGRTRFGFTAGAHGGVMFTATLPSIVGRGKAAEYLLTPRPVEAEEALVSGLLNQIFPQDELVERAHEVARAIASNPRPAMRETRRLLRESEGLSFDDRFALEISAKNALMEGANMEGVFAGFLSRERSDT